MSQTEGQDAAGNLVYQPNVLAVQPLTVTQGYSLEVDDPTIYKDGEDMDSFYPRREWADKNLSATSSSVTSPQVAGQAEMIQSLLKVHHVHVEMLKSSGVDTCKEYEQSRVGNVLARVLLGVKKCNLCNREFHNIHKLGNYMKMRHLGKASYECKVCNRFFQDSGTLKIHSRKHQAAGLSFKCTLCGKIYVSLWKLNEHKQSHVAGKFVCVHCNREFHHGTNLKDHSRPCSKRPATEVIQKHKCTLFGRGYNHKRDLTHHIHLKHSNA